MATSRNKPVVDAMAKYKVEYRYRSIFGIIGKWFEVKSVQVSKPHIFIETGGEGFDKVFVNGDEYKAVAKEIEKNKE